MYYTFLQIESGGIHMTVKEFREISASKVFALIPNDNTVSDNEYNIFHTRTNRTYVFADDCSVEEFEIDFIEAAEDDAFDEPVIYVYTK